MYRLKKSARILKSSDFKSSLNSGRKVVCSTVLMIAKKTDCKMRMGLIVSKKVGNAVTRNQVKRKLREVYRNLDQSWREHPWDIVVIARKCAATADYRQILKSFYAGLQDIEKHL